MSGTTKKIVHVNMPPVSVEMANELLDGFDAELVGASATTEEELVEAARDADAIIGAGMGRLLTRDGLAQLTRCRIVSLWAGSTDFIDLPAFTEHKICVSFAADECTEEVADHGMAMMLAVGRKLFYFDRVMRERKGHYVPHDDIIDAARPIPRLSGLTVGSIGLGRAGLALAARSRPFGMRFVAFDPFVAPDTGKDLGVVLTSMEEVLRQADFLHLYVPMKKDTVHIIGAAQLAQMKPTAYLINSSARSQVIDEAALLEALTSGKLAGAALDNLDMKPDETNPLLQVENLIVTPHISHVSDESYAAMQRRVCQDVVGFFNGQWPKLVANPEIKTLVNL
ncbi:MAG TPA: C-terminal binding protein [Acidimicrobiales bacterium]|jgi:D-3-phosphoglycerate dehydrogenase